MGHTVKSIMFRFRALIVAVLRSGWKRGRFGKTCCTCMSVRPNHCPNWVAFFTYGVWGDPMPGLGVRVSWAGQIPGVGAGRGFIVRVLSGVALG